MIMVTPSGRVQQTSFLVSRTLGRDNTFLWSRGLTHPLRGNRTASQGGLGPNGGHLGSDVVRSLRLKRGVYYF